MSIQVWNSVNQKFVLDPFFSSLGDKDVPKKYASEDDAQAWIDRYVARGLWYPDSGDFVKSEDFEIRYA